jgi:hypothetical protein
MHSPIAMTGPFIIMSRLLHSFRLGRANHGTSPQITQAAAIQRGAEAKGETDGPVAQRSCTGDILRAVGRDLQQRTDRGKETPHVTDIVILGVFMADTTHRAERMPRMGETIHGTSFALGPGGKGSNQAVAAARAGANVGIPHAARQDAFADMALKLWAEAGSRRS